MPGTLTVDHINKMHDTDLESGEFMKETDAAQLAASTQPAQHKESKDWGAEKVGGFQDELVGQLTEILENLKEPLQDATNSTVWITNIEQPVTEKSQRSRGSNWTTV
eukprot:2765217-Rhodomonas_salina.1